MKRKYRAVLFDLDGTLADSLADLANATNAALQAVGCPPHPPARYRIMVGDGARTLCIRAVPADRPELVDEVRRRIVELMGNVPRLEMFARTRTPGWDTWGNEVKNSIELPARRSDDSDQLPAERRWRKCSTAS